jgi:nifR3 family TIM-barrel protein
MTELLRSSPVRLAPMAGLTNVPFRQIAIRCGSGFTTNEEIDADALYRGSATAEAMARNAPSLGVVAMQLLGNSAETLVPAAHRLLEAGADIIDINMGCPVPKVVRRGKGAALMRDIVATGRLLSALRRELDVPLTIKIRGGWNDHEPNAVEVAMMAQDVGVDAITVHPRTRAQQFGGRAPWDVIRQVVEAVDIPVTGNGDVTSIEEARRMMAETGCAAVMIGRGALGRPWVFDVAHAGLEAGARMAYEVSIVSAHLDAIEQQFSPHDALVQMKKHLAQYSVGWPECRSWRVEMFACTTIEAIRQSYRRLVDAAAGAALESRATG